MLFVVVVLPAVARADARYVKPFPAPGSNVGADTRSVNMVFGERLNPQGSSITVTSDDGARADQGDASEEAATCYDSTGGALS